MVNMSKYKAVKTMVDGIVFDSRKEAKRYVVLRELQKIGAIADLRMQVKYVLIPELREQSIEIYKRGVKKGQPKEGKLIEKECSYKADFVYLDRSTGLTVVEDVKGMRTKDYIIKRKLMLHIYNIRIKEI